MKQDWPLRPLGEVCEIIGGGTPSKDEKSFYQGNIPWATVRDMKGEIISSTECMITEEAVAKSSTNIIPANNVVIATRVGLGKVCLIDQDTAINQDLRGVIPKNKKNLSVRYLFWWLKSVAHKIEAEGTGATVKGVKLPFVKSLLIPVPEYAEQQRIVATLDKAFAGIATATANAEKNLQNARELFDSYLHSLSYETKPLGALVEIKTGKLNANAAVEGGEYPFFTCSREISQIDNYAFDCEAILLAGNNASGDFNVKHYHGKFNAYQRTYVITVKNGADLLYRYLYYQMMKGLKDLKESSVGAGTKFLKLGMIQNFQIALPDVAEQKQIVEKLDRLSDETKRLEGIYQQKLEELADLNQSILQKAFAGELH